MFLKLTFQVVYNAIVLFDDIRCLLIFKEIYELIIDKTISRRQKNAKYGVDQRFLAKYVYNLVRNTATIHNSYQCVRLNDSEPFPTRRNGSCFIGNPYQSIPDCTHNNGNFHSCPKRCRPKNNPNWKTC